VISFLFIIKANLQKLFLNKKIYFKKTPAFKMKLGVSKQGKGRFIALIALVLLERRRLDLERA